MTKNHEQAHQTNSNQNELSDEHLDNVVGGGLLSSPLLLKAADPRVLSFGAREYVEDVEAY